MKLNLKLCFFLPPWHQLSSRVRLKEGVDVGLEPEGQDGGLGVP